MALLKSKFISTVAGTALSVAGALGMANSAYADDANMAGKPAAASSVGSAQQDLAMLTRNKDAPLEEVSRKDAFLASKGKIVLHYGRELSGVNQIAEILNERGYDAIALRGAKTGEVSLFVDHGIYGPFGQYEIDGGELGLHAATFYEERIGPPTPPSEMVAATPAPAGQD